MGALIRGLARRTYATYSVAAKEAAEECRYCGIPFIAECTSVGPVAGANPRYCMLCGAEHNNRETALLLQLKYLREIEEQERADRDATAQAASSEVAEPAARDRSKRRSSVAAP